MLDILIKNGTVIDGTGAVAKKLDVAIEKGTITEVAPKITRQALETIDAKNQFVTPGFIDIQNHSDSYWTLFDQPAQSSLLAQGITSIVIGNCGSSLAPLLTPESIKGIQKWHNLEGVNVNWATMSEFFAAVFKLPLGVNVATLVGHATLRRGLIGDAVKKLSDAERKILDQALRNALNDGALGLSMGLIYAHEVDSNSKELVELAKNLSSSQKYLSVHLRSESSHILEALEEVIDLAGAAKVPVKISHLKIRNKKNWHLFDKLMSKLEIAYHQGINISFDVYPYDTSWSVLYTYLPKWAYEGGRAKILQTINDKLARRKILDFMNGQDQGYGSIIVAEASGNNNFVGKTIAQIAENQNVSKEEAILNVISATGAQVIVFDHNLASEQVELMLASPLSMIATDGAGYSKHVTSLPHPRCFGTMPRFLKMVREKKLLKWEYAIKKITSEPAKLMGITNRGIIAPNMIADVAVFNPQTITDKGDYVNPDILPEGMDTVVVNGKVALSGNEILNLSGTVIKR